MKSVTSHFTRVVAPLLCLAVLLAMGHSTVSAQEVSNKGKDFVLTFLPNFDTSVTLELHLTGANTEVTIHYPMNNPTFTETVTVSAGDIEIVTIPTGAANNWTTNDPSENAVRAFADDEFVAYMVNRRQFSTDASLALPVEAMNTEYFVVSYPSTLVGADRSQFAVVAAFDNTTIEITPTAAMGTTAAGDTRVITLDRGESFLGQANTSGVAGDLTGTLITGSRPFGMTSGNKCTNIPSNASYCDHIFQVAPAAQTWGNFVPVANLPLRPQGSVYRVIATEDDTELSFNGTVVATLDRGEFYDSGEQTDDGVFSADKPIYVTQFMTGSSRPGTGNVGDPAMGVMVPAEQYLTGYTFSTVGGRQFAQHYLTVIAHNEDIGVSVMLNGSIVPAGEFSPLTGSDYSVARVALDEGVHNTTSVRPHGVTVQGYNRDDSYLYAGGARFEFIAGADENPPICEFVMAVDHADGTVRDDRPDDSGVFFVRLAEGSQNVALSVDPFEPGAPLVNWRLSLVDATESGTGTVVGIDGSGNQCRVTVDFDRNGDERDECDLIATLPSWDGHIHSNGDGTGYMVLNAPQGLMRANFYNTTNLQTDLSAEGYVMGDHANDWVWDGAEGEEPTQVTVHLETVDKSDGRIQFWVRIYDTCPRWVDIDPEMNLGEIPVEFALEQNYPNPFNPTTTIVYHLPEATHVTLTVYDVLGREVMQLVNGQVEAGSHTAIWHGTRSDGTSVSSGMYIYRLEAGSYTSTQTMSLIK
jgi:hypothetical protein